MTPGGATVVTPGLLRGWSLGDPGEGKASRGTVLVVGGSASTPGAVRVAGEAALRAGAGKLAIATAASVSAPLGVAVPESRVLGLDEDADGSISPGAAAGVAAATTGADALLAGPGFTDPDRTVALLAEVLPHAAGPVVLDALATAYLTEHPDGLAHLKGAGVVTANPGELARLLGRDDEPAGEDLPAAAAELAARSQVVVLAGAAAKHVATPDGRAWVVEGGGPGLGVSGSGDVQAGIVAGLLARGEETDKAAVWGAYLHARAGERLAARIGTLGYLAREIPAEVPRVLAELS